MEVNVAKQKLGIALAYAMATAKIGAVQLAEFEKCSGRAWRSRSLERRRYWRDFQDMKSSTYLHWTNAMLDTLHVSVNLHRQLNSLIPSNFIPDDADPSAYYQTTGIHRSALTKVWQISPSA
jgi:hypothetical protein